MINELRDSRSDYEKLKVNLVHVNEFSDQSKKIVELERENRKLKTEIEYLVQVFFVIKSFIEAKIKVDLSCIWSFSKGNAREDAFVSGRARVKSQTTGQI